jgi:hypothetical protein
MSVNDTIVRWLTSSEFGHVTGVVLAANWRNSQTLLGASANPADQSAKLGEAVRRTLAALRSRGLRVLVLGQVPPLPYRAPECVFLARDMQRCGVARSTFEAEHHDLIDALQSAVAPFDNARFVDPALALCDAQYCLPARDGEIDYIDATHLSDAGARVVRAHFADDFAWLLGSAQRETFSAGH